MIDPARRCSIYLPMPSVGMRRTTRVFGARVLRSGRRLWTVKNNSGEWVELLDNSRDGAGDAITRKERGRHGHGLVTQQGVAMMDVDQQVAEFNSENLVPKVEVANDLDAGRRWGIVYSRKRKMVVDCDADADVDVDSKSGENSKRFGKHFFRKRLKRKAGAELTTTSDSSLSVIASGGSYDNSKLWSLLVVVDPSTCSWSLASSILSSILRYMWSASVSLQQLSAIISMKTIASVFSSCGICFLKGPKLIGRGSCMIWSASTSMPIFRVDYYTAPYCFMYLNSKRALEFDRLSCSFVQHLVDMSLSFPYPARSNASETSDLVALAPNDDSKKIVVSVMIEVPNSDQNVHIRSGHHIRNRKRYSRSKRGGQPSSLGVRKSSGASPSSLKSLRGHNGAQVSPMTPMTRRHGLRSSAITTVKTGPAYMKVVKNINHVKSVSEGLKSDRTRSSAIKTVKTGAAHMNVRNVNHVDSVSEGLKSDQTRSSAIKIVKTGAAHMNVRNVNHVKSVSDGLKSDQTRSSAIKIVKTGAAHVKVRNVNHVKSVSDGLKSDVDPTSCSANVLVLGSEMCYRIVGARISLEALAEKQWNLVIKKDGMDPFILVAQRYMRPSSKNRVTNAVVWNTDNDWKLEFQDKQEWYIFKELYKKCSLLNTPDPQNPGGSSIPIPGVREVSDYVSSTRAFRRPVSYISMKDDELSRALAGRTAIYDMDSEDELWLNNLNGDVGEENLDHKPLSADDFELAIEALEKAFHCNPDAFSDECVPQIEFSLGRKVLEAVYGYWSNKKKQRRSALIKVFQLYQPRRVQLIPNSILRKKRSFKRQVSSVGRGKHRPLLQAMAAERNAREKQNSIVKVVEAKAAANRSEELAILKRQRAQQLMEAADLAMYKAAMALRVAEMAQNRPAPDTVE